MRERYAGDFKKVTDEVLAHLAAVPGVRLTVSIEIEAEAPDGFDDAASSVQLTITRTGDDGLMRRPRWCTVALMAVLVLTAACASPDPTSGDQTSSSSSTGPGSATSRMTVTPGATQESVASTGTAVEPFPPFSSTVAPVSAERLGASYRVGCPVGPEALRLVGLSYVGFDGTAAQGELVVAGAVVEDVVAIFAELYRQRFPIRGMVTVEAFGADDDASMAVDNTSAFNCRPITGGQGWSQHSYGVAIDLNPRKNPYVTGQTVLPPEGRDYLDRANPVPGMIRAGDPVMTAFAAHGFAWGGYWTDPVDYQHFEW
ncbi:MAG: M15 family metallopeptidase [Geodermatophilaceae bacterium]